MKIYKLNELGQKAVTHKVLEICSQHEGIKPDAFFNDAEDAVNDGNETGQGSFEIHRQFTDSKNPVVVDVYSEWFDTQEIDDDD